MRVGTRKAKQRYNWSVGDHPHACGDKKKGVKNMKPIAGSSPCVWGQVAKLGEEIRNVGIIPMRVGTSSYHCPISDTR